MTRRAISASCAKSRTGFARKDAPNQEDGAAPRVRPNARGFKPGKAVALAAAAILFAAPLAGAAQELTNDYPTIARAEYVFGCMEVNGVTPDALRRCSCSIDVVASILPYEKYVQAETVMSVIQVGGEKAAIFHDPSLAEKVADLRRAQAEGEIRCF